MGLGTRYVEGDGHVQAQAKVWVDQVSGGDGTTQAHFFLHGKDAINIIRYFLALQFPEGFQQDKNRNPVVDGFAVDAAPHLDQVALPGDGVADGDDFDYLLFAHAQIDEVIADWGQLAALLGFHQMDGLRAHDADDVFPAMDDNAL